MIAIYDGPGTIWKGKISGEPILKSQILAGDLQKFSTLIMPGGRDRPYHAELKGRGNSLIREFVEAGGTYLGICAGAYYGSDWVEFEKGYPLEVFEKRELGFFKGSAIGPAYGKGIFEYGSEKGALSARLIAREKTFHSYYNGGPYFSGDFTNVKILARYMDLPDQPPAIIECTVGKGKAILSGVHIEMGLSHGPQGLSPYQVKMQMKHHLPSIGAVIG